ncbi:hypothetical protein [Streptomyces sp. NPDC048442]|uniref:hypothetical protein n=1 Tax=Streptomyces sp. NPDC048442 TaxID=3154823 RepID=UPI003418984D
MTMHQGEGAAADSAAAARALKAQLFEEEPAQPGQPCPCGETDGLHGEECDCEEGAVLIHTMRIGDGVEVTEWQDTFRCSFGCNEYLQTVTLPDAPWGGLGDSAHLPGRRPSDPRVPRGLPRSGEPRGRGPVGVLSSW